MSQTLVVGVDIAKKDFAVACRVGDVEIEMGKYRNEAEGYGALQVALAQECARHGLNQIQLVLEATGGYEAALVAYAYENQWLMSLPGCPLGPKQVRDWAKGVGYRVKTDRVDARILANYGAERRPPLRPQLAVEVTELDSLLKRRLDLEKTLHQEQNRLSEIAGRPGLSPKVAESLQQIIEALTQALNEIQEAIDELCQTHEPFQQNLVRLLALPGIGPKVVLPLLVKLLQWQNMTAGAGDTSGLVAFIGLDPQPYDSGQSVHKHPGISKMGDSELRRLLYMGALGGVRGNNPLKSFYQRLIGRGKAKKVALVAAARKILVWAWTIFSRQIDWNPDFHQIAS
jgi:transposase